MVCWHLTGRLCVSSKISARFCSTGIFRFRNGLSKIGEEVREALHAGKPVVALESTIITHGMPYPHNLNTALTVESIIRQNGCTPATIAVLDGIVHTGLTTKQLEYLADPTTAATKISRRDFPHVLAKKGCGGTTVSGTMLVAHKVGIPIFVTGGIGGVHRDVEKTMDISADLRELGKTPVAVISAGVKSILDIGKTLEYLETEGVCVVAYGKSLDFPAFFTAQSGFQVPYSVESPAEAAVMIDKNLSLSLGSGMLIGVPVPEQQQTGSDIEEAIQLALTEAKHHNIKGKAITPYVLDKINDLTSGISLQANITLVKNNADVGSQIAVELAKLRMQRSQGRNIHQHLWTDMDTEASSHQSSEKQSTSNCLYTQATVPKRVVVIGGSNIDFNVTVKTDSLIANGATYAGNVQQSFGGVGRNIAECLNQLDINQLFVSAIGKDSHMTTYRAHHQKMDISGVAVLEGQRTATYCAILNADGELMFGIGDMDIHKCITPCYISEFEDEIAKSSLLCVDGNVSPEAIADVCELGQKHGVPVWFDPADLRKAEKPFLTSAYKQLTYASPNLNELCMMFKASQGQSCEEDARDFYNTDLVDLETVLTDSISMATAVIEYIPVIIVTLGRHGILVCSRSSSSHFPVLGDTVQLDDHMTVVHYPACNPETVVSVSGAGDCLAAAMMHGIVNNHHKDLCVCGGLLAAQFSLQSSVTVPQVLSSELFLADSILTRVPCEGRQLQSVAVVS